MDYRKNNYTPRDRVDDEMLARLLGDEEESVGHYGKTSRNQRSNSCGCRNRNSNERPTPYRMARQEQIEQDHDKDSDNDGCCCEDNEMCEVSTCLSGKHLAMAYHPDHEFDNMFEVDDALSHGTLFKGLEFPFYPACESCR